MHIRSAIALSLAGAVLAAFFLTIIFSKTQVDAGKLGATLGLYSLGDAAKNLAPDAIKVMTIEAVGAFLLMLVILGSAVDPRGVGKDAKVGGFAIGRTVTALILAIGPLTGASMNPCRSFGPALVGDRGITACTCWARSTPCAARMAAPSTTFASSRTLPGHA